MRPEGDGVGAHYPVGRFSREDAHNRIKTLGGTAKDNVTKNTAYLVVGENPGENKLIRARALGTEQINEEKLLAILGQKN